MVTVRGSQWPVRGASRGALPRATALVLALAAAGGVALAAPPAAAQAAVTAKEKQAARVLAQMGYELFVEGKYEEAIKKLDQAEGIFHAPPHHELAGRALEKLGRLLSARERYERVVAEPPTKRSPKAFHETHAAAVKALESLETRIPSIQLKLNGAGADKARVTLDGEPVPAAELRAAKELDPGTYTIRIQSDGMETETRTVTLAEGSRQTLELVLRPKVVPDRRGPLWPGVVTVAAGAAGLGLGAAAGAVSLDGVAGLREACPDKRCPLEQAGALDQAKTLAAVSTAGFVAGGALAAAGAVLLVVRPGGTSAGSEARLTPVIGPGYLGVEGVF